MKQESRVKQLSRNKSPRCRHSVELEELIRQIEQLVSLSQLVNQKVTITIIGQTDSTGTAEFNQKVGNKRAQSFFQILTKRGIPAQFMKTKGMAPEPIASAETNQVEDIKRRAVKFQVDIGTASKQSPQTGGTND